MKDKIKIHAIILTAAFAVIPIILSSVSFNLVSVKPSSQFSKVTSMPAELPWEAYIDFTILNSDQPVITIKQLLLTTNAVTLTLNDSNQSKQPANSEKIEPRESNHNLSHKKNALHNGKAIKNYEFPLFSVEQSLQQGEVIKIEQDRFIATAFPSKYRIKFSILQPYLRNDIRGVSWSINPLVVTTHGEFPGEQLVIKFSKPSPIILTVKEIKELQNLLLNRGFKPGPIDGQLGNKTAKAIKNLQQKFDLVEDGAASGELLLFLRFLQNMK